VTQPAEPTGVRERAPAVPAAPDGLPVAPPRRKGNVGDMVRSLVVTVVGGALVFGGVFFALYRDRHTAPVRRVDDQLAGVVSGFQGAGAPFPLLVPTGLPTAWAPTSVQSTVGMGQPKTPSPSFRVGYLTPGGRFADLEEAAEPVDRALAAFGATDPVPAGTVTVGTASYVLAHNANGVLSLSGRVGSTYVGVTGGTSGGATQAELVQLLASLR